MLLSLKELKDFYRGRYVSATDLNDFLKDKTIPAHHANSLKDKTIPTRTTKNLKLFLAHRALHRHLTRRARINHKFLKKESRTKNKYLTADGHPLDKDQIKAVLASEDATLVLAPAGSGKTATLLAKVDYLISHDHLDPAHILLITFTRKVVAELKERISHADVNICTFHSLGHQIIQSHTDNYAVLDEAHTATLIHRLVAHANSDPKYKEAYNHFIKSGGLAASATVFTESHHESDERDLELLFLSIINLHKSKDYSLKELKTLVQSITNVKDRATATALFRLYAPIYHHYIKYLEAHHFYDYSDMLNTATRIVKKLPPASFPYQYILVDEAQDMSDSKCALLSAVLNNCTRAKLFAVGDDWQSIYRFAGSNLEVLDNFEQTFHRATFRTVINSTYRFGQPTARISNKFIEKNPRQSHKRVKPAKRKHTPIYVRLNPPQSQPPPKNSLEPTVLQNSSPDNSPSFPPPDYLTLDRELVNLYHEYGDTLYDKSLQIISRYNRDVFRLVDKTTHRYAHAMYDEETSIIYWTLPGCAKPIEINFCTMHRSKGITRDIVFVINLNKGYLGMPATRADNPLMATMLTKPEAYPYAEERRLFYVAITRARERTILIADRTRVSDFVYEISPRLSGAGVRVCPRCHRGILELRHSRRSHSPYHLCPHCHYIKS
ncbi:UvrD-helicase domain-containing protein [Candidatus Saccharibacteria bacterium]|nr:UvrD-helicase domain-containing protein [Candidatus Saccharibacteria bacterium]